VTWDLGVIWRCGQPDDATEALERYRDAYPEVQVLWTALRRVAERDRGPCDPFEYALFGIDRGASWTLRLAGPDGPAFKKAYKMPWSWIWSELPRGGIGRAGEAVFRCARTEPTGAVRVPVTIYTVNAEAACAAVSDALSPEVKEAMQARIAAAMARIAKREGA